jgi:nucleotide-binding universal stress UspA family protein
VLVPLDGSEFALQALPTARALAGLLSAELQTVSIAGADDKADRLRALAAASLGVNAEDERVHVASAGDPAEVIARRAAELEGCVVCLTSHGRGRLGGALVGSVARSVLQRSTNAMVVLGPMADNPGRSPRPRSWPEPLSVPRLDGLFQGVGVRV